VVAGDGHRSHRGAGPCAGGFSTESPRQSEHRSTESQSMLFWGVGAAATVLFAAGVTAILMRGKRSRGHP